MSWFQKPKKQYSIIRRTRDEPPRPVDHASSRGGAWRKVDRLNDELSDSDDTTWFAVLGPGETLPHTPSFMEMQKLLEDLHITLELQCLSDAQLTYTTVALRSVSSDQQGQKKRFRRRSK